MGMDTQNICIPFLSFAPLLHVHAINPCVFTTNLFQTGWLHDLHFEILPAWLGYLEYCYYLFWSAYLITFSGTLTTCRGGILRTAYILPRTYWINGGQHIDQDSKSLAYLPLLYVRQQHLAWRIHNSLENGSITSTQSSFARTFERQIDRQIDSIVGLDRRSTTLALPNAQKRGQALSPLLLTFTHTQPICLNFQFTYTLKNDLLHQP